MGEVILIDLPYFCCMDNVGARDLHHFIAEQLDSNCILEERDDFSLFICPTLTFDIILLKSFQKLPPPVGERRRISINEGQLNYEFEKIKNRLKVLSGKAKKIYARQTVLARIDKSQAMEFQQEHHLQVAMPGKYRYGLYLKGELVSIAIFSGGRKMRNQKDDYRSFELIRFCHKSDYLVIGGISKLIKGFIDDFHPGDIMTYVDKDWSQDSSLKTIGFEEKGEKAGGEFWVSSGIQYPISNKAALMELIENHPHGYLSPYSGSIKLVLAI